MDETQLDQDLAYTGKSKHIKLLDAGTRCKILEESLPVYRVLVLTGTQKNRRWWIKETWLAEQSAQTAVETNRTVKDLGLSVGEFEKRMRSFAKDADERLSFALAEKGNATRSYNLAPEITIVASIDKGKLTTIALFSESDPSLTLSACGYLMRACEPQMNDDARGDVLRKLGIADFAEPMFSLHHQIHCNGQDFTVAADGKTLQLGIVPASKQSQ